ncbi:right-handed parallel beta-helix repeat-containing protein [Coraliomargarita parva]|uniref:right-handed parallel beta-helix repeat-containing protein n=1 Tax=Coraliomargarita parva TaxID=3014050 RepID=UPI0022B5A5D2|nr:right-handed parallel beta-helix repeat-containing protein [Coraliomargarita parva]
MTHFKLTRLASLVLLLFPCFLQASINAQDVGLVGDGVTDNTAALQLAMAGGDVEIVLPEGVYLLGTVEVPGGVVLRGEPGAKIRINTNLIQKFEELTWAMQNRKNALFILKGDHITLRDLEFDYTLTDAEGLTTDQLPGMIITGKGFAGIQLIGLKAERPQIGDPIPVDQRKTRGVGQQRFPKSKEPNTRPFSLAHFEGCSDILMRDCRATFMSAMLSVVECSNVWADQNRATDSYAITIARGGNKSLMHTQNWSRNVSHQCRWFGGNANDHRKLKEGDDGWDTATEVVRDLKRGDEGFNNFTQGEYDIIVANNYAEYGQTLSWGAKGRKIIFQGNIARFMTDYAIGSEGGEEVIFNGNVVTNGYTAGFVCMYWSDKLVFSNNIVMVKDEPIEMEYSTYSTPEPYQGNFIRLHSAGPNYKSGAGQTLITGNLFVNELKDRPRNINIAGSRDVTISNNKFVNGGIRTKGGTGRVLVLGNDFRMNIPYEEQWLRIAEGVDEFIFRNNVVKSEAPLENRSPTEWLMIAGTSARRDEAPKTRMIEENVIEGFPKAVAVRVSSEDVKDKILVSNNRTDGGLYLEGLASGYYAYIEGNVDLRTMSPMKVQILNRVPDPLPEPKPTPQDLADEDSEKVTL